MKKCLYFICPTDFLETVINGAFNQENYYLSSLGNSITFDNQILKETKKLIREKNIDELIFVLSNENRIVLDALRNQHFSMIRGLNKFYKQVVWQQEQIERSWQTRNPQLLTFSYHLNNKIRELKHGLKDLTKDQIKISGKIYNNRKHVFSKIYPDSICMDDSNLN
ncbi:MAG: hypothetical protein ACI9XO_001046 [Paraglaciecola sp.]|jgi:hypothetical protein